MGANSAGHPERRIERIVASIRTTVWNQTLSGYDADAEIIILSLLGTGCRAVWTNWNGDILATYTYTDSSPLSGRYSGIYSSVAQVGTYKVGGWIRDWSVTWDRREHPVHLDLDSNIVAHVAADEDLSGTTKWEVNDSGIIVPTTGGGDVVTDLGDDVVLIGSMPGADGFGAYGTF